MGLDPELKSKLLLYLKMGGCLLRDEDAITTHPTMPSPEQCIYDFLTNMQRYNFRAETITGLVESKSVVDALFRHVRAKAEKKMYKRFIFAFDKGRCADKDIASHHRTIAEEKKTKKFDCTYSDRTHLFDHGTMFEFDPMTKKIIKQTHPQKGMIYFPEIMKRDNPQLRASFIEWMIRAFGSQTHYWPESEFVFDFTMDRTKGPLRFVNGKQELALEYANRWIEADHAIPYLCNVHPSAHSVIRSLDGDHVLIQMQQIHQQRASDEKKQQRRPTNQYHDNSGYYSESVETDQKQQQQQKSTPPPATERHIVFQWEQPQCNDTTQDKWLDMNATVSYLSAIGQSTNTWLFASAIQHCDYIEKTHFGKGGGVTSILDSLKVILDPRLSAISFDTLTPEELFQWTLQLITGIKRMKVCENPVLFLDAAHRLQRTITKWKACCVPGRDNTFTPRIPPQYNPQTMKLVVAAIDPKKRKSSSLASSRKRIKPDFPSGTTMTTVVTVAEPVTSPPLPPPPPPIDISKHPLFL
jgi:hypothetical protein